MLQLNEVMQETETDEPVKTAVIEFLDSLSLVINDQKLAPNYGMGEFLMHLFDGDLLTLCRKPTFDPFSNKAIIG